ncbi:MAG: DUF2442 domain-containing protein [Cyanobacteria bacterium J06581_3]
MSTETSFEVRLVPHANNHWDIVSARYEKGNLHIEFQDKTRGSIPVSHFPTLSRASDADFDNLEVSPCGLILENENIEWDYAEAGLYKIVKSMNEDTDRTGK